MAKGIQEGDKIPSFTLEDENGEAITISPEDRKKRIIFFYPKDNTRKCIEEVCSFRDWYDEFLELGFEVIGISSDSVGSHQKFKSRHHLNFKLLSDPNGEVRKNFGATLIFNLLPHRSTFAVDENGIVFFRFDSLFNGEEHVSKLLNKINS